MMRDFVDATFGISSGEWILLASTGSDAEHKSIPKMFGLVRLQTNATIRFFMHTFAEIVYGKALRQNVGTVTDGCPMLTTVSEELEHGKYGSSMHTRCEWHAVGMEFNKRYLARHGKFDGGVGTQTRACVKHLLRTAESQDELEDGFSTLMSWLQEPKPPVEKRFRVNSAAKATLSRERRSPKHDAEDDDQVDEWDIERVFHVDNAGDIDDSVRTNFVRVHWANSQYEQDTIEALSQVQEIIGTDMEVIENDDDHELPDIICGSKLGQTKADNQAYTPRGIYGRFETTIGTLVRVGWMGYSPSYDTYEYQANLKGLYGDDVVNVLIRQFEASRGGDPSAFDDLPDPDCIPDPLDYSETAVGFTEYRRAQLVRLVQDIVRLNRKLALVHRRDYMHLYEFTSNRIESLFWCTKYVDGKKQVSKKTGTAEVILVTARAAKQTDMRHAANKTSTNSPTVNKFETWLSSNVARALTRKAYTIVSNELKLSKSYTCVKCECPNKSYDLTWKLLFNGDRVNAPAPLSTPARTRTVWMSGNRLYCTCPSTAGYGVPCRHMLHVLMTSPTFKLMLKHFHPRWWVEMYNSSDCVGLMLWADGGLFETEVVRGSSIYIGEVMDFSSIDELATCSLKCTGGRSCEDDDFDDIDHDSEQPDDDKQPDDDEQHNGNTHDDERRDLLSSAQQHTANKDGFENVLKHFTNKPQFADAMQRATDEYFDTIHDIINSGILDDTLTTSNGTTIYVGERSNRASDSRVRPGWDRHGKRKKARLDSGQ